MSTYQIDIPARNIYIYIPIEEIVLLKQHILLVILFSRKKNRVSSDCTTNILSTFI